MAWLLSQWHETVWVQAIALPCWRDNRHRLLMGRVSDAERLNEQLGAGRLAPDLAASGEVPALGGSPAFEVARI
jgi:hypothetical protein